MFGLLYTRKMNLFKLRHFLCSVRRSADDLLLFAAPDGRMGIHAVMIWQMFWLMHKCNGCFLKINRKGEKVGNESEFN